MVDVMTALNYSGLRHAGGEHNSFLPGSATYKPATPRLSNSNLKFPGRRTDCVGHENRLNVGKALRYPKPSGAGCLLGDRPSGAIRLTGPVGHRALRPEQQPRDPHPPLGTSERGPDPRQ